ncbi:ubiquinone biosynthesis protein COQ9 [Rhizophagus irregularis]|uniref:Ubiquinone biosynthesis protein n=4 Tax=Rhizophagus irregularis TaxID=588596 RepID=A0A2I1E2P2_9GLOM|nr:Coq9p [Rhizophagus irregularis DAOM 197198w]PKC06888.1 ubiquinone biosynthesis protein COQ9 [Rhizophagus irregularis]GBC11868.2 rpsU-divergently transcribed protein [Rhizophagus irregularis DAOM 181602=DAOM 197198]PKC76095.1 ubiquinone biosynthesis protein COQ9 [Rhizophagus irregularis]PKY16365.1 ubiquinone biosynthesis protein COQ9 [Rhizophagus irregularis]
MANFLNISRSMFKRKTSCIYQGRVIQPIIWRNVLSKQQNIQNFTSAAENLESVNSVNSVNEQNQQIHTPPPTPPNPPNPIPAEILKASLPFVNQYGWSIDALSQGAKTLGYPNISHGLFPKGGAELIDYFLEDCRRKMSHEIFDKMNGLKVHQKIRFACVTRLNLTKPYIRKWPEALAIMAQPNNVSMAVEHLAKLVDDMWYLAGDKSADMNWYSKRAILAAIYTSTELYMTQDTSPDFTGTYQFLNRRLQDSATFGSLINEINTFANFAAKSTIGILSSKGIGRF